MMLTLEILKCTPRIMWLGTPNCGLKRRRGRAHRFWMAGNTSVDGLAKTKTYHTF